MHVEKMYNEKIVDSGKKSIVAIIQLKRTLTNGTTLFVKSPMFEEFFKSNENVSNDDTVNSSDELVLVKRNIINRESVYARNFDEVSNNLINSNGEYNIGFLRCENISNGIEFKIHGLNSKEALEKYKENATRIITGFYNDFMKSTSVSTKIQVIEDMV